MYLAYFDETKYSEGNPYFFVGGILLEDDKIGELETTLMEIQYNFFGTSVLSKDTEIHGKELFHGKGAYKGRKIADRVQLFRDISTFINDQQNTDPHYLYRR